MLVAVFIVTNDGGLQLLSVQQSLDSSSTDASVLLLLALLMLEYVHNSDKALDGILFKKEK